MKILISTVAVILCVLLSACTNKAMISSSLKADHIESPLKDSSEVNPLRDAKIASVETKASSVVPSKANKVPNINHDKTNEKKKKPLTTNKLEQPKSDMPKQEPPEVQAPSEPPLDEKQKVQEKAQKQDSPPSSPLVFPEFYAPEKYKHPLRHSENLNFMIGEDDKGSYLYGEGPIVQGAYKKFLTYVNHYKKQGVELKRFMLHSPGGVLDEGIQIGEYIHNNGWDTDADKYMRCYSTCGFIYSAGTKKHIQSGAEIGFHRPYLPGVADTPDFIEKVYNEYQIYWTTVDGNKELYDKFMLEYDRDEMLILKTNNIDNYIPVEKY
ncbi:hypothetical protein [Vibrio crassostreae]|uniref:hypothetical protein n=1 Tax=Vibrio crassostreae TaxID=246167 RepID=UPI001BD6814B|nr:hypothetical protein [Vibrio crassostreae]